MHINPGSMTLPSNYPLLFIMSAIHGHMIHLQNNTMNKLLCLSTAVVCSYIATRLVCLAFKNVYSVNIPAIYYVCQSGTYDLPPNLSVIINVIQWCMLRRHCYLPACVPFKDICSAPIIISYYECHSMMHAPPP